MPDEEDAPPPRSAPLTQGRRKPSRLPFEPKPKLGRPKLRRASPRKKPIPKEIDPEVLAKRALERKKKRAALRLSHAKRKVWANEQVIKALSKAEKARSGEGEAVLTEDEVAALPGQAAPRDDDVLFRPNPGPQTQFLAATEREVFYGGARGGGKSMAMIVDPLRWCAHPGFRALFLRRTMPELRDIIAKTHRLYPQAYPGAKWREQDKLWLFPSGARIEFGYAENEQDALRYQGQSYTAIYVDELPQWPTPAILDDLRACLRSTERDLPTFLRATGNPGNIGSGWVKELFIDPAPPGERFEMVVEAHTARGPIRETITRRFIPASVYDNPHLLHDGSYLAMLASLPETRRRQYLEGDWDASDSAAFPEFRRDIHVFDPFEIPSGWPRFRAADWGFSSPACCLWFAIDPDGMLWVYRELYVKKLTADMFARAVLAAEQGEHIRYGVLDSSAWAQRGDTGPSIAEQMIREGCRWRPADRSPRSRHAGKIELHRRLAVNPETDEPTLRISTSCRNLLRTLPLLPVDTHDVEDVDTDAEDHAYDALRYGIMSRPVHVERPFDNRDPARRQAYEPASPAFGY